MLSFKFGFGLGLKSSDDFLEFSEVLFWLLSGHRTLRRSSLRRSSNPLHPILTPGV